MTILGDSSQSLRYYAGSVIKEMDAVVHLRCGDNDRMPRVMIEMEFWLWAHGNQIAQDLLFYIPTPLRFALTHLINYMISVAEDLLATSPAVFKGILADHTSSRYSGGRC